MTITASVLCVALALYKESRGEETLGQHYVANVILNRAKIWHLTPCQVIAQPGQFPWYAKPHNVNKNSKEWELSLQLAKRIIAHPVDKTGGAIYFNEKKQGRKYKTKVAKKIVGNHIFY